MGRMQNIRERAERAEAFVRDLLLTLFSIVVVVLAVIALIVLATQTPVDVTQRAANIALVRELNFLAKAQFFATLILPWTILIIGLLLVREIWMIRRRLDGIHYEYFMQRWGPQKKRQK